MLRISSFPLSVSFTLPLLFLTPPPPFCFSHPLPICLSLILPLSLFHFTILFLSPSRCFKAHITPFSLSILSFCQSLSPKLTYFILHLCICVVVYTCSLFMEPYQLHKKKSEISHIYAHICLASPQMLICRMLYPLKFL